jgi:hypothetical protein
VSVTKRAHGAVNAGLFTRDELKRQERETNINALKRTNGKVSGPGGVADLLCMKPSTLASLKSERLDHRHPVSVARRLDVR